jgi:ABC-type proline/glycine betaine transport system permease subunit
MATWLTVNIVLSALFFAAMVGIPLWMVIKRPDTGEGIAETTARVQAIPLHAVSREEVAHWREAA